MNMRNKMKRLGMMASLCVMMSFGFMGKEVRASETTPAAPTFLQMNQEITQSGKYMVTKPGRFELINGTGDVGSSRIYNAYYYLFVLGSDITTNPYIRVPAGEYVIQLRDGEKFKFVEEPSSSFEQENNNTFDTANLIEPNIFYNGYIEGHSEQDYFRVDLKEQGSFFVEGNKKQDNLDFHIYKEEEGGNIEKKYQARIDDRENRFLSSKYIFPKGTYYICFDAPTRGPSEYKFKVNFNPESSGQFETESNNTKETANEVLVNQGYIGNLSRTVQGEFISESKVSSDVDYYRISLKKTGKANLRLQTPRQQARGLFKVELQKADGTVIDTITSSDNPLTKGQKITVMPGDYYIKVSENGDYNSHVDYNIQLEYEDVILVDKIEVTNTLVEYHKGDKEKLNLSITPTNAADKAVVWESTDPKIATVDQDGEITAVGIGETIVRAKLKSNTNIYGEARIVVKKRLVEEIELSADKDSLEIGETIELDGTYGPSNADEPYFVWESMNEEVAEVDQYGLVTAKKPGKVSIKILADDGSGVTGSITLTVNRAKRTNANLKTLKLSTGRLNKKFTSKRGDYVLTLSRASKSVKITPVVEDKFAKFTINGKKAKAITVKVGRKKSKTVTIVVTNDDAKKTYKIKVVRK